MQLIKYVTWLRPTMRMEMLLVSLLGAIAFITFASLMIISADSYTAIEQSVIEFMVMGRLPGTDIYFDFDALVVVVCLLFGITFLSSVLIRIIDRRLIGEHADQVGI